MGESWEELALSRKTVDEHVANACERLGVRTRTQAVVEAMGLGLLPLSTGNIPGGQRDE